MKIFTVSTGRCGTQFISRVFETLTDYPSFHEPAPFCAYTTLEEINTKPSFELCSHETRSDIMQKIKQVELDSDENGNYFESNQMFGKCYWSYILRHFKREEIGVIYLWRNPIDELFSWFHKSPERNDGWHIKSNWRYAFLRTEEEKPFYENVLWEWHEVKERYYFIREHVEKSFEMPFSDLNNVKKWKDLFNHFGVNHVEFNEIPDLDRNESKYRQPYHLVIRNIKKFWGVKGKLMDIRKDYNRGLTYIEYGKKVIARKKAELNKCRM